MLMRCTRSFMGATSNFVSGEIYAAEYQDRYPYRVLVITDKRGERYIARHGDPFIEIPFYSELPPRSGKRINPDQLRL